jgi:hypothetical protein
MKEKAVAPIAIVAVVAIIMIVGFILNVFIGSERNKEEIAQEIQIIKAINAVESVKRGLPYALYYSYSEALKRDGHTSFSQVENKDDFKANILSVFQEYMDELEEKSSITVPGGDIALSSSGSELAISFSSSTLLTYEYSSSELSFKISENPNVTIQIENEQLTYRTI